MTSDDFLDALRAVFPQGEPARTLLTDLQLLHSFANEVERRTHMKELTSHRRAAVRDLAILAGVALALASTISLSLYAVLTVGGAILGVR